MSANGHDKPTGPFGVTKADLDQVEAVLRRLNHKEWLLQFSQVLSVTPSHGSSTRYEGLPMTPFRAGAITRLAQAAQYIHLLEQDIAAITAKLEAMAQRLVDEVNAKNNEDKTDGR